MITKINGIVMNLSVANELPTNGAVCIHVVVYCGNT